MYLKQSKKIMALLLYWCMTQSLVWLPKDSYMYIYHWKQKKILEMYKDGSKDEFSFKPKE